jgi:hypothetical protein
MGRKLYLKLIFRFILSILAIYSGGVFANWNFGANVLIQQVVFWEGSNSNPMFFQRSDGVWCAVSSNEKLIISMIMSLYVSGKKAAVHCHAEGVVTHGGMSAHKFHRIIAK